ncbi:aryl-alcohol dehydrogenase [Nocardioides sp. YR527]|uniref:NAD(P)-dependent alcohol dehydrogenase n=1 Tax=Nocardioides sp. YR527 TaxID=1881028 RepID=UPI0008822244|nr:NAD(P)-dependent alcohol dehydrogenase [Nocardioides sp. YR527]SDL32519.1 aryl-alcohol dehydrogenase [Nocardioides sp. YR527]
MVSITAAVAREHEKPLTLESLELDDLRGNEVRVRMVATGICHTDAIVRDGVYPTPLPAVLGHEGAGVVEAVGDLVTSVVPGDHVVMSAAYCRHCDKCRTGQMAYCENLFAQCFGGSREDGTTSLTSSGERISSHFFGQSSFATHANVVEASIIKVDSEVPLDKLAPLGCGMQTGAGAVLNEIRPRAGSSFAVIGTGAVGMAAVMAARVAGCTTIVAIDRHQSRLDQALELGATHTINTTDLDLVEELKRITDGAGVDAILDTTALPKLLASAVDALAIRGTLALVGAAAPGTEAPFEIGGSLVKGWTFKTIVQGSSVPQDFIPRLVSLWKEGRFPLDRLIKTYQLDQINEAFEASESGAVVKPVLVF